MRKKTKSGSKQQRTKTVLVSSKGVAHVFDSHDVSLLERLALGRTALSRASDLGLAISVDTLLKKTSASPSWIKPSSGSVFRIVEGIQDPLEMKYTLGAGGRVNVGFSQVTSELPHIRAIEGLYGSLDKITAIAEYDSGGIPHTENSKIYELKNTNLTLTLIDFDSAVAFLATRMQDRNLTASIAEIPTSAMWKYQKVPKASQIIGNWLINKLAKAHKCDGLVFSSTKNPSGKNIFILNSKNWVSQETSFGQ